MMSTHGIPDYVIQMNDAIRKLTVHKAEMLRHNWRDVALNELPLNEEQTAYIRSLSDKSVSRIQHIVDSALREGGELKFETTQDSGTSLIATHAQHTGASPLINIKVCSFDGFFQNCKWFPR